MRDASNFTSTSFILQNIYLKEATGGAISMHLLYILSMYLSVYHHLCSYLFVYFGLIFTAM